MTKNTLTSYNILRHEEEKVTDADFRAIDPKKVNPYGLSLLPQTPSKEGESNGEKKNGK